MKIYHKIHPNFKLNGSFYSREELREIAYSFIKEGIRFEVVIGKFLQDWLDTKDVVTVNTSGSTGVPKSILLKKEHMVNSAIATGTFFNLKPGNTALHCLPTDFIAGKMMLVRAIVLGLEIDCIQPSSSPLAGHRKSYEFAAMIPLQLENSIDTIEVINTLIIGGAPVSKELRSRVQKKKTRLFETYGMTETITHIAAKKVNHHGGVAAGKASPFIILPHISIMQDDRGCLQIDAPKVSDSIINTNDIVKLVSNIEFEWLGRYDSVINSGGIKLIPEQIEAILDKMIANRFFVAGIPDKELGEKLILVVEGDANIINLKELLNQTKELSKYQVPKEIYSAAKFIETPNGKLQRSKTVALVLE